MAVKGRLFGIMFQVWPSDRAGAPDKEIFSGMLRGFGRQTWALVQTCMVESLKNYLCFYLSDMDTQCMRCCLVTIKNGRSHISRWLMDAPGRLPRSRCSEPNEAQPNGSMGG